MEYYNKDVIKDLDHIIKGKYFDDWFKIVKPFLLNDELQRRKLFKHHSGRLWDHITEVSYYSYLLAKIKHADEYTAAVAGLLHDFYPKAYKYTKELDELDHNYVTDVIKIQMPHKMHGFTHAKAAAINARKYFGDVIDEKIYSSIVTHMFPLTPRPPKYPEGWIVQYIDKYLSIGLINRIRYKLDRDEKK